MKQNIFRLFFVLYISRLNHLEGRSGNKFTGQDGLLGVLVSTAKQTVDLTWVAPLKSDHHNEHQQSIEDIDENLVLHEESVVSLDVFNHANNGTNQNEDASNVKGNHVASPDAAQLQGSRGGASGQASLENDRCDGEEAEEDDLNEKTADNDVFPGRRTA